MNPDVVALAEYKSVRAESLEALSQIHTIVQYGLASVGVSVGLGLVTAQHSTTASAMVLMGLIPTLIVFGVVMMAIAVHRVIQSRQYLRYLEAEMDARTPGLEVSIPGWERTRAHNDQSAVNGYPFAIVAANGACLFFGPGLGGYLLASRHLWVAFIVGEVLDLTAISVFAGYCRRTYRQLVAFNATDLTPPDLNANSEANPLGEEPDVTGALAATHSGQPTTDGQLRRTTAE